MQREIIMKKLIVILAAVLAPTFSYASDSCNDAFEDFVTAAEKSGLTPQAEIPLNESSAMYVMGNKVGSYAEVMILSLNPLGNPSDPKATLLRSGTCKGQQGQVVYYVVISVKDPGVVTQN
jgi:hypothetical protein